MRTTDADDMAPAAAPEGVATSRRTALAMGAGALAGLFGGARPARAQGAGRARSAVDRVTVTAAQQAPVESPSAGWTDPTMRLLRRITYHPTPADIALAKRLGYKAYLEYQLNADRIPDTAAEQFVATTYPTLRQSYSELLLADQGTVISHLVDGTVYRAAYSNRQLHERMVEFWSDHFNINVRDVQLLKVADDRDVIRQHALGNFGDLVKASAHSAAMMAYLDNNTNRRGRPNENYARELMELHTLGVDGGYTQQDVAELARVLTGWTLDGRTGAFRYDPTGHDFGAKTVLGVNFPATTAVTTGTGGKEEGDRMLDVLVAHPNTARFIASKLLTFFVSYAPTEAQVAAVAATFTQTKGDIKAVLRTTLQQSYVAAAPPKHKRPFHFIAGSLRAAGTQVTSVRGTFNPLTTLGMVPMYWETPDGYPDKADYWASNVLPRWNWASTLANSTAAAMRVDITPFRAGGTNEAVVEQLRQRVFAGELTTRQRDQFLAFLNRQPASDTRVREVLSLALGSSNFQWY